MSTGCGELCPVCLLGEGQESSPGRRTQPAIGIEEVRELFSEWEIQELLGSNMETVFQVDQLVLKRTAADMSPEQHDPQCAVDARSDTYSLGVLLDEMLTGSLPRGNFLRPQLDVGRPRIPLGPRMGPARHAVAGTRCR